MEQVTSTLGAMDWLEHLLETLDDRTAKVVVVGQGYVGLPVAMRAVEVGFPVVGFDTSTSRSDSLARAVSYVEDVPSAQLAVALERGYLPTSNAADLNGFDVAVITVPTPLRDGAPDLSFIESAARALADHVRAGCLVILESTTYPGTTEELLVPILERSGLRAGQRLLRRLLPRADRPGQPEVDASSTRRRSCRASTTRSRRAVRGVLRRARRRDRAGGSTAEAELVKLLENTFRHVNIALVNELAMFARDLGVDIWSAIDAASTKPFGYMRFTPGPGVGGHCLPIDPSYLSWRVQRELGAPFRFVELANDVNATCRTTSSPASRPAQRAEQVVRGSRILVIGLAYKAGTSDWRESPSTRVIERLVGLGADVRVHDDHVPSGDLGLGVARVPPATRRRSTPPTSSSSWSITPTFRTT